MKLTQNEVRQKILALGAPAWSWQLVDSDYETVSAEYVFAVWGAWMDSLRANAPELLEQLALGGGKTRVVPKWVSEAGDCDNHALLMSAHAMMGNWLSAARGGSRVGRAFGPLFFVAQPRAENRQRAGGHAIIWFIDHSGMVRTFEPGDGDELALTELEYSSAFFGLAA